MSIEKHADQIKRIRELADMKVGWIETDDPGQVREILDSTPWKSLKK